MSDASLQECLVMTWSFQKTTRGNARWLGNPLNSKQIEADKHSDNMYRLHVVYGLILADIAKLYELNLGTVWRRIQRTRERMKDEEQEAKNLLLCDML